MSRLFKNVMRKLKNKKRKFFIVAILSIRLVGGSFNMDSVTKNGFNKSHQFVNKSLNIPNDDLNTKGLKVDFASNDKYITKVILVKNEGFPPGADGFTITPTPNYRHKMKPRVNRGPKPQGLFGLNQNVPLNTTFKHRQAHKDVSQPAPNFKKKPSTPINIEKEYDFFIEDMVNKGLEVDCDLNRFTTLCVDPQKQEITQTALIETKGGLQGEAEKLYKNLRRPTNSKEVLLDFEATDIKTGKTIFLDHKGVIDIKSLTDQGTKVRGYNSHSKMAYNIGKKIPAQKERFLNKDKGPQSVDEVWHLVDFGSIRNSEEKPDLVKEVLKGAEKSGNVKNIFFINHTYN